MLIFVQYEGQVMLAYHERKLSLRTSAYHLRLVVTMTIGNLTY